MSVSRGLSIGALARAAGVHLETIRYYERIGLMAAPARTEGGHRTYEDAHRRRLEFIRRGRELGFSIEDIRALLKLADGGEAPCDSVIKIAAAHLQEVRAKIADLTRLEKLLADTVAQCESNADDACCPVLEMLDGQSAGSSCC